MIFSKIKKYTQWKMCILTGKKITKEFGINMTIVSKRFAGLEKRRLGIFLEKGRLESIHNRMKEADL